MIRSSDPILLDRPTPEHSRATDFAVWGSTHLKVRDLDQSLRFWRDLLGLATQREVAGEVAIGVDDAELIVLHEQAARPVQRGHAGLYHVALHLPSARAFAKMVVRLLSHGVDPRPTDHLLHWAMYLNDSDGIGVELSFETPDRFDHVVTGASTSGGWPVLMGTDGQPHGPVEPLDVEPILAAFPAREMVAAMPSGTRIGHNHLHVADLDAAGAFYEHLGFAPNPSFMRMRDFNAAGSFAHRLAINEWQGHGASPTPADAAGLHHLQLSYATTGDLDRAIERLGADPAAPLVRPTPSGAAATDPSGNPIVLLGPTP